MRVRIRVRVRNRIRVRNMVRVRVSCMFRVRAQVRGIVSCMTSSIKLKFELLLLLLALRILDWACMGVSCGPTLNVGAYLFPPQNNVNMVAQQSLK